MMAAKRQKTTQERGYGESHRALRRRLQRIVAAGDAICTYCSLPVEPGPFHVAHDDFDRSRYRDNPISHVRCNIQAARRRERVKREAATVLAPYIGSDGSRHSRLWEGVDDVRGDSEEGQRRAQRPRSRLSSFT